MSAPRRTLPEPKQVLAWLGVSFLLWLGALIPHYFPLALHQSGWRYLVPADYVVDDFIYFSRANRIAREGRFPGNTYLREDADGPVYHRYLDSVAIAPLLRPFLPDFRTGFIALGLLLTLLMSGAMFLVFTTVTEDRALAWLGALGMLLIGLEENLSRVICHRIDAFLPLLIAMFALRQIHLGTARGRSWAVLMALGASGALYGYPFLGIVFDGTLILVFLTALFFRDGDRSRTYGLGLLMTGLLALPFILHQRELGQRLDFSEIQARIGFLRTHFPSLGGSAVLLISAAALPLLPVRERWFFGAALASGLVCLNQHVLTGNYVYQNTDHLQLGYRLPIWMAFTAAAGTMAKKSSRVALACVAVLLSLYVADRWNKAHDPERIRNVQRFKSYSGALEWLDRNASAGDVVVSGEPFSSFLAAETPYYPFSSNYAYVSLTPSAQLWERALRQLRYFGMTTADLPAFVEENYLLLWGTAYPSVISRARILNKLHRLTGVGQETDIEGYKQARLDEITTALERFKTKTPFGDLRADFAVYGPWEKAVYPRFQPSPGTAAKVYEDAEVSLWRIRPENDTIRKVR